MHVYPNGARRPIAYVSRTLNEHEKHYGQIDKEALAIMFGLKRFHLYLHGQYFTILTDHKPLERISGLRRRSRRWQPCGYNDGRLFSQPSITALNLCHRSKTQLLMHYHAYPCRRRVVVRMLSSRLKNVW